MTEIPQELQEQIELEDTIIELLASLWTMYDKLPELHPLDKRTFQEALHKAQAIVLARPKIRGILMARQGLPSQETQEPQRQPVQVVQPTGQPVSQSVPSQKVTIQPSSFPSLGPGEKAAAIPIYGTGGTKTLPGAQ